MTNLMGIMTKRECCGQITLNVVVIHTINMFRGKMECIQGEAPHAYCQIWAWIIDVFEMFCCQWLTGTFKINGTINSTKYQEILAENLVAGILVESWS